MQHWKLTRWCNQAVSRILYLPDRRKVFWELHQHLDDRCDAFLAEGMDTETAVNKAVEAMGDPHEIAAWLGKIHKPWLGWASDLTKWLSRLAVIVMIFALVYGLNRNPSQFGSYRDINYDTYQENPYDHPNWQVHKDGGSFSESGYHVKLDQYAVNVNAVPAVFFQLKITNFLPWAVEPEFPYWLEAKDSLGRYYTFVFARSESEQLIDRYVAGNLYHSAPGTWTYHGSVHIEDAASVSWIDLMYRLDGRNYTLRLYLEGGAS